MRRLPSLRLPSVVAVTLLLIVMAVEIVLIAPGHVLSGGIVDGVLVFVLVTVGARVFGWRLAAEAPLATVARSVSAARALALVPLMRVTALGLPLRQGSPAVGTLVLAGLLGSAAVLCAPALCVSRRSLWGSGSRWLHALVALSGLLLGYLAYLLGAPALWAAGARPGRIWLVLIAAIAAGAAEELVFRGTVQVTFQRACGRVGVVGVTALFASTYLGAGSAALVLLYALAGIAFAHVVARTERAAGAVVGHVLLAVGAGGLWPVLFGRKAASWAHDPATVVAMAAAVVIAAAFVLSRPVRVAGPDVAAEQRPDHV